MARLRAADFQSHRVLMRSALLTAFGDLLAERDYGSITLADIADRAQMARNTIYNYARDKDALFAEVVESKSLDLVAAISSAARTTEPAADRLTSIIGLVLDSFTDSVTRAALLQEISGRSIADPSPWVTSFGTLFGDFEHVLTDGIAEGAFDVGTDIPLTIDFIAGVLGVSARRIAGGEQDVQRLATVTQTLVLRALRG